MQALESTAVSDQVRDAHRPRVLRILGSPGARPIPMAEHARSVTRPAEVTRLAVLGECTHLARHPRELGCILQGAVN